MGVRVVRPAARARPGVRQVLLELMKPRPVLEVSAESSPRNAVFKNHGNQSSGNVLKDVKKVVDDRGHPAETSCLRSVSVTWVTCVGLSLLELRQHLREDCQAVEMLVDDAAKLACVLRPGSGRGARQQIAFQNSCSCGDGLWARAVFCVACGRF